MKFLQVLSLFVFMRVLVVVRCQTQLCLADCSMVEGEEVCVFKFSIDIFAGHNGYYRVEGCEGIQPTLGMKFNTTYIFDQTNVTNWFHPLGFAYGPDGVYRANQELEKGVPNPLSQAVCDDDSETDAPFCDYPQYKLNDQPLCSDPDDCFADFGLDEYEGVFFSGGRDDWIAEGNFTVEVKITDPATTEIFYFCHIHNDMSARIKILDESNQPIQPEDLIPIPYEYEVRDEFDQECGTTNATVYKDVENICPSMTFLCDKTPSSFDKCMNAIDCAMHVEMRVQTNNNNPVVTFMHQMIPHHRNAVNMAKILLKLDPPGLECGTNYDGRRRMQDLCSDTDESGGRPAETLLWDIINTQNQQITFMNSWLSDNAHPAFANCLAEEAEATDTTLIVGVSVGVVGGLALATAILITYRFRREISVLTSKE